MTISASGDQAQPQTMTVGEDAVFGADLATVGGIGPGFPHPSGPGHGTVDRRPALVDPIKEVVFELEHAGLQPLAKTTIGRAG